MDEVDLGEHADVGRLQVGHRRQHLRSHTVVTRRYDQLDGCSSLFVNTC